MTDPYTLERAVEASTLGARSRSKRDVGDRLRTAALDLFLSKGYDAVTVNEIADSAGVTPRTFFRYFPSKETIVLDLTDQTSERLVRIVHQSEAGEVMDVIQQSLTQWFSEFADLFAVVRRLTDNSDSLLAAVLLRKQTWERNLADAIAGRFPDLSPAAAALWGSLGFWLLTQSEDYSHSHHVPFTGAVPMFFELFVSELKGSL